jgi:tape measure domain-containing protein
MPTDLERLVVRLEADINKFTKSMEKASADGARASKKIDDDFGRLNTSLKAQMDGLGSVAAAGVSKLNVALGAIGIGLSFKGLQDAADEYTRILNTLRAGGIGEGDLKSTFDQLFAVAQRNSAPIEGLAQLFGRVTSAQKELGVSSQQIIGLTERVAQALRINGTSAEQASGALLQLGQALGGGKIQAEEFNSLVDGLRPLLGAAAAGLTEAGGSVAKLTALVKDGQVSSKAFFAAIEAGSSVLDGQLANAQDTAAQATTRLKNEFVVAVAEFDRLTGASASVASGLGTIAGGFGTVAKAAAVAYNDIIAVTNALRAFFATSSSVSARTFDTTGGNLNRLGSSSEFGLEPEQAFQAIANTEAQARAQREAADAATERKNAERELNLETQRAIGRLNANQTPNPDRFLGPTRGGPVAKITPVSINDPRFRVTGDDKGGGGRGSGGGSAAEETSAFDRQLKQIEQRRLALENEALTIGKGTFEIEKSRAAFELERAAKEASIPVTDSLRGKIDEAAEAYARAKVNVEEITKSQAAFNELQQFIGSNLSSFFSDIVSGGENAQKALSNLVKKLAEAALQATLLGQGPLASLFGTAPTGGAKVGGLLGGLFGLFGRSSGGPVSSGQVYRVGENGPELFAPGQNGSIVSAGRTASLGGGVVRVMIESDGTLPAMIRAEAQGVAVKVTQAGIAANNSRIPAMLAQQESR